MECYVKHPRVSTRGIFFCGGGVLRNEKKPVEVYRESCVKATSADLMREIGTPNVVITPGCRWFLGAMRQLLGL